MDTSSRFKIDFGRIPADGTTYSWHLDDDFFGALDEQEIEHGSIDATLRVNKNAGVYELNFGAIGQVEVQCDRCLEPMTQAIDAHDTIKVRLGNNREDEGDLITIPEDDPTLDVAWNLYETIALAIPITHVHPDGECRQDMADILMQHAANEDGATEEAPTTDSRWDALKALLGNS